MVGIKQEKRDTDMEHHKYCEYLPQEVKMTSL